VPLPRRLTSEFGPLCQSPSMHRKFNQALAFTVGGLIAFVSGTVLVVADHNSQAAFVPASVPFPNRAASASTPTTHKSVGTATLLPGKGAESDGIKSCQRNTPDHADANCDAGAAPKTGVVQAATDPPAPDALPVGHDDDPALGVPESTIVVANTPPQSVNTAASAASHTAQRYSAVSMSEL